MHEYTFVKHVVESIQETLLKQGNPGVVREVILKVGELELHSEEAFKQAFEMLVKDTPIKGAKLSLIVVRARINCPDCGYQGEPGEGGADPHDPLPCAQCPSCGRVSGVLGGRGVESIELVLNDAGGESRPA